LRYLDEIWFANRFWPSDGWHLEKWIWRHISEAGAPIWTKFDSLMQNNMQISAKSKLEVDFRYGGRLFFKKGSNYILAVNWSMSTKFGFLIDFDVMKAVTSTNIKPEVVFSCRGRHFEKWIWRHISAVSAPIWTKFSSMMHSDMQITAVVEIKTGSRIPI